MRYRYLESFRRIGVRGNDLLTADKKDITHFGITDRVHVRRFEAALKKLSDRQKNLNADAVYLELKKECDALRQKKHVLPQKMEMWSTVDVMFFLTLEKHATKLEKLVRPLAINHTNGKMLLKKCEDIEEKQKTVSFHFLFGLNFLALTLSFNVILAIAGAARC